MRHFIDAPPSRPRSASGVVTARDVSRRGNNVLYPSVAPVYDREWQPKACELPDGKVVERKRTKEERALEQSELRRDAAARLRWDSERAAHFLQVDALETKRWRAAHSTSAEKLSTAPSVVAYGDPALRFRVGERVECNVGARARSTRGKLQWQPARVLAHHHHAAHFPHRHSHPYLIEFEDDGSRITVPVDDESVIRPLTVKKPTDRHTPHADSDGAGSLRAALAASASAASAFADDEPARLRSPPRSAYEVVEPAVAPYGKAASPRRLPHHFRTVVGAAIARKVAAGAAARAAARADDISRDLAPPTLAQSALAPPDHAPPAHSGAPSSDGQRAADAKLFARATACRALPHGLSHAEIELCHVAIERVEDAYRGLALDAARTANSSGAGALSALLTAAISPAADTPTTLVPSGASAVEMARAAQLLSAQSVGVHSPRLADVTAPHVSAPPTIGAGMPPAVPPATTLESTRGVPLASAAFDRVAAYDSVAAEAAFLSAIEKLDGDKHSEGTVHGVGSGGEGWQLRYVPRKGLEPLHDTDGHGDWYVRHSDGVAHRRARDQRVVVARADHLAHAALSTGTTAADGSREATDALVASLADVAVRRSLALHAVATRRARDEQGSAAADGFLSGVGGFLGVMSRADTNGSVGGMSRADTWPTCAPLDSSTRSLDPTLHRSSLPEHALPGGPRGTLSANELLHHRTAHVPPSVAGFVGHAGRTTSPSPRRSPHRSPHRSGRRHADGGRSPAENGGVGILDQLADAEGQRLQALIGTDGPRGRSTRGLGSTKRHLCGSRWDDDEIIRLAFLMEKGEIVLDSLDVQAPNNVGGEGIRALCRALLFGANELTALRVRADAADDAALLLLAATLSARDTRREALSRVQHADATQHVPPHAASGGSVLAADDESARDVYFTAAPMLHEIDIAGGARTSAHGMNAISAARRSRLVLAPASEASMRALAAAARMPSPLRQFRASLDCTDGSAEHLERRRQLFSSWDSNGSGCLSLAEVGNGVLTTLSAALGQGAHGLYHRFYRMYIRAFHDTVAGVTADSEHATEVSASGGASPSRPGGAYVTRRNYRALLSTLRQYAVWYEVFLLIDGGTSGRTIEDDHRLSCAEWCAALRRIRSAGASWAPYTAFKHAAESDFASMDASGGGYVSLDEFIHFVAAAEKVDASAHLARAAGAQPPPHLPKAQFVVRNGRLYTLAELADEEALPEAEPAPAGDASGDGRAEEARFGIHEFPTVPSASVSV